MKCDYLLVGAEPSHYSLTSLENGGYEQIVCAGPRATKCKGVLSDCFWHLNSFYI